MNGAAEAYRRGVRRCLRCGPRQKRRLMELLDQMLRPVLEEHADPEMDQLVQGLGTPEDTAKELRKALPAGAEKRWSRLVRSVAAALLAALFLFLLYEAALRPIDVHVVKEVTAACDSAPAPAAGGAARNGGGDL